MVAGRVVLCQQDGDAGQSYFVMEPERIPWKACPPFKDPGILKFSRSLVNYSLSSAEVFLSDR